MREILKWYRLDTSAKIYPALESLRNPALFRVAMTLKEKVDPEKLLIALENIKKRFPYYNVHLKRGLFWHYLEENTSKLKVWHDTPAPCERIHPLFNNGYLYKVRYYNNKIALDIFHVLTDGYGASEFLKCLVNEYLLITGTITGKAEGILDINDTPKDEEYEDAFLKVLDSVDYSVPKERTLFSDDKNYIIKDKPLPVGRYKVVVGIISVEEIKRVSKEYDATITQVLASLYIESLIHLQAEQVKDKKKHQNVSVQIPVNMRKYYPYNCMRNFSLFVIPTVDPREVNSFDDIVKQVKSFMKENLTEEHLLSMVYDNCSLAQNPVIKHVPVGLKSLVIRFINNTKGSTQFSGTISNLGIVKLPENISEHVESATFTLGSSTHNKCSCGVTGYNNNLYLSFGRSIEVAHVEKHIFERLVKMGVNVKVKSNY